MRARLGMALALVYVSACAPAPPVETASASATPPVSRVATASPFPTATAGPIASGSRTFATICGAISDWLADSTIADGSFTLNSPGRSPIALTIPKGRLGGGGASGYVCVGVLAGVPHPLFDGFGVSGAPGYVDQGVFPATAAEPAPKGFVPPQACAYAAPPHVVPEQTTWLLECGPENDRDARGTLSGPLTAQGWRLCGFGAAAAQWWKDGIRLGIAESSLAPGDYPRISQSPSASCS